MPWNYRLVRRIEKCNGEDFQSVAIHEAYYFAGVPPSGKPHSISKNPIPAHGETKTGAVWAIERMLEACHRPVIDYETREPIHAPRRKRAKR